MGWRSLYPGDGHIDFRLVYGPASDPRRTLAELSLSEASSELTSLHAHITDGTPGFRLSSSGWTNFTTRDFALITSEARLWELVREKLNTKLPTFAVRQQLFVDRYLADAKQRAQHHFGNLEAEIFGPEDWIYTAFLPLPNARIELPDSGSATADFAELSVLFWTGELAIGVLLDPPSAIIGSKKRNLERLKENWPQFTIINVPRDQFAEDSRNFPTSLFPDALNCFWDDVEIPQGPCLSNILEKPLTKNAD